MSEQIYQTKRLTIPAAEEILGIEFPVLDHGFVRLIDYMGGDPAITEGARVSYGRGTKPINLEKGLIRNLMRKEHTSPFEMVELKWHCKMPIFVARHWIRHRTANVNEESLRYSLPEKEFYIPGQGEVRFQSITSKQGSRDEPVPTEIAKKVIDFIAHQSESSMEKYEEMIQNDIARELARIGLPINIYTQWHWKNDLHNTLHFLKLRTAPDAQYEIRQYANAMGKIVKKIAPIAYGAFEDYVLNSMTLSALDIRALQGLMQGKSIDEVAGNIFESKGERNEFMEKYQRLNK
ncbi:FAD-dependent thymidylate synthase [Candidatus Pacearchaeota archaeon]|nr:FAD-dependent thymidylate synthase [Candidatus Pacearchaeota archaeon]